MLPVREPDSDGSREMMRAGLRGVVAPLAPLVAEEHMLILCSAVEVWDFQLVVHLLGIPTDAGVAAQARWEDAFEEWGRRRALAPPGEKPAAPPPAPGDGLARVELEISDSHGTRFTPRHSSGGGTGSEWRGLVALAPGPAAESRHLTVSHPSGEFPGIDVSAFPRS